MTKKDYILIAKVLKDKKRLKVGEMNLISDFTHSLDYEKLLKVLCEMFSNDNSRFDEDIFRKACGEVITK
jgi:hypothetical protein